MESVQKKIAVCLAGLIEQIKVSPVADSERKEIRQHLLDGVASAAVGCRGSVFKELKKNAAADSLLDEAMLWAFAINGSVFEDGTKEGACHPAAAIIPVVLSLGDSRFWSQIDRAVLAGYDVMVRLARAGNPQLTLKGFHPTAIMAPFGAASTAAVLLDLDDDATVNALCLAAMGGSGLMASFKNGATQPLQVAWSVRNGVQAALLAKAGHAGYLRIFEEGYFPAYLSKELNAEVDAPLSRPYAINSCYLKPYPGCRHLHASMDALDAIIVRERLTQEQIDSIHVGTYKTAVETEIHEVRKRGDAYFNIPYAFAARVVLGRNDFDAFDEKHFDNEQIVRLMKNVEVAIDHGLESLYPKQRGALVSVTTTDGRILTEKILYARGEKENPLPLSFTQEKFKNTTAHVFGEDEQNHVISMLNNESGKSDFGLLSRKLFED